MTNKDLFFKPAYEILESLKSQTITSQELIEKFIERIKRLNPLLNAYCTLTFELARSKAKSLDTKIRNGETLSPLEGVPIAFKDDIEIKGVRTTFGSKIFENYIPKEDEIVVKRLKNAGVIILGKTNMPEQGFKGVTDNLIFGVTKNPWNLKKTPGGSSGGSAAAVASGLCTVATGSDGGGSVRIPSSFCGTYGFKPTFGRIPQDSMKFLGNTGSLVHFGPIVRYVKDAALMMDFMTGPDYSDRYSLPKKDLCYFEKVNDFPKNLKVGYSLDLGFAKAIDSEVEETVLNGIHKFDDFNFLIEQADINLRNPESCMWTFWNVGFAYALKPFLKEHKNQIDPELLRTIEIGLTYSTEEVKRAEIEREIIYEMICKIMKKYDILLTPTTACLPFELNKSAPDNINDEEISPLDWIPFTYPFNISGHPVASIPCGWSKSGLPIGMQIIGKRLEDLTVLRASKMFEEIAPWQDKRPAFN